MLTILPRHKQLLCRSRYTLYLVSSQVSLLLPHLAVLSCIVLDHMDKIATRSAENGLNFKLREGYSAETSGTENCRLVRVFIPLYRRSNGGFS